MGLVDALGFRTRGQFGVGCGHGHSGHRCARKRSSADTAAQEPWGGGVHHRGLRISYPDKDFGGWVTFPATTVTLRSGPSNSCIQTEGIPGQLADYLCYAPGDGGTWTFLRNVSTGDQGWVRDDLLPGNGSQVSCEQNPPPAAVNGA